jgi:hypothetical protein
VLADLVSKFIYSLYIYSGKNLEVEVRVPRSLVQAGATYKVVMNLLHRFENKGYCNIMDNILFHSFFRDLEPMEIYTTAKVRSNRIGLPLHLKNTRAWTRCEEGHIEWALHESRDINCIIWRNKCPVLLISSRAIPIGFPCMPVDTMPRRHGTV